jgi:hypothetical protein
MMVLPRTIVLWPNTGLPPEQLHTFQEGQRMWAHAQQANAENEAAQWQCKLTDKQAITVAQPYEPPRHKPVLEAEMILMVDLTATWAQAKGVTPTISHEEGQCPVFTRAS